MFGLALWYLMMMYVWPTKKECLRPFCFVPLGPPVNLMGKVTIVLHCHPPMPMHVEVEVA